MLKFLESHQGSAENFFSVGRSGRIDIIRNFKSSKTILTVCQKWAFANFYARVAFLAPEAQAPLARNELKTLTPRKWAFPPTLQSTFYARVAFLAPEAQAPLARNESETLTPRKWAFPPTLQSTFDARVAFLAPEPQAPLARNE